MDEVNSLKTVDVSISCLAYNHEAFIQQALDGFLSQKTNYSYEILIHDDASTDGTAEIIRQYHGAYPDRIRPIFQKENQYKKRPLGGIRWNFHFPVANGKYIAFCDGDDYWSDTGKLQQQVDLLESDPSLSLCFHSYKVSDAGSVTTRGVWSQPRMSINEYARITSGVQTLTVVARNIFRDIAVPSDILRSVTGSYFLFMLSALHGDFAYIDKPMAVYRVHPGGVWSGKNYCERGWMQLSNKVAMTQFFIGDSEIYGVLRRSYVRSALQHAIRTAWLGEIYEASRFLRASFQFGVSPEHFLYFPRMARRKLGGNLSGIRSQD